MALSQVVTFEQNVLMSSDLAFIIQNDIINELPEVFTSLLSFPSIGLQLGESFTATVNITDDDGKVMRNISHVCCCP